MGSSSGLSTVNHDSTFLRLQATKESSMPSGSGMPREPRLASTSHLMCGSWWKPRKSFCKFRLHHTRTLARAWSVSMLRLPSVGDHQRSPWTWKSMLDSSLPSSRKSRSTSTSTSSIRTSWAMARTSLGILDSSSSVMSPVRKASTSRALTHSFLTMSPGTSSPPPFLRTRSLYMGSLSFDSVKSGRPPDLLFSIISNSTPRFRTGRVV
mmetsp:Transcript_71995/g.163425  ORF Transcript_71995/g.163425 Transcript_71995/m.163425 type:complete len:209 (+) Transcript_71995:102-728(+)